MEELLCRKVRNNILLLDSDAYITLKHRFVDRDMFMRYLGLGLGHQSYSMDTSNRSQPSGPQAAPADHEQGVGPANSGPHAIESLTEDMEVDDADLYSDKPNLDGEDLEDHNDEEEGNDSDDDADDMAHSGSDSDELGSESDLDSDFDYGDL